jgi:WD40 repeat protein
MKTLIALIAVVLFTAACSSGGGRTPPPLATATPTLPAQASAPIAAANAVRLQQVRTFTLPGAQTIVWSVTSDAVFVASRTAVIELPASGGQGRQVVAVASPEAVLSVSALGQAATSADGREIEVHAERDTAVAQTIDAGTQVADARFSPDGKMLVLTRYDKIAADLWDLKTGRMVKELTGFQTAAPVYDARFSSDGKSLVYVSRATVQLQDVVSGQMGPRLSHEDFVSDVAVSPDGTTVATSLARRVQLWPATGAAPAVLDQPGAALGVAFSPDGSLLAVATEDGVVIWDLASRQQLAKVGQPASAAAFSPDGRSLAVLGRDGGVSVWQAR